MTACRLLRAKEFLQRWGSKTAAQLVARFQEAKFSFHAVGLTDDEDIVRITAFVLQVNGARAEDHALTRETADEVHSVVR
jgi:hypothetical protein